MINKCFLCGKRFVCDDFEDFIENGIDGCDDFLDQEEVEGSGIDSIPIWPRYKKEGAKSDDILR